MATPYALAAVYILCLALAEAKRPAIRVMAAGLWASALSLATLIVYSYTWAGWERQGINALWTVLVAMSLVWCVLTLRRGRPRPPAPPQPSGMAYTPIAPFDPEPGESNFVSATPHATRQRYESRRRRVPIYARERSKRQ